jgi:hypothetical protein
MIRRPLRHYTSDILLDPPIFEDRVVYRCEWKTEGGDSDSWWSRAYRVGRVLELWLGGTGPKISKVWSTGLEIEIRSTHPDFMRFTQKLGHWEPEFLSLLWAWLRVEAAKGEVKILEADFYSWDPLDQHPGPRHRFSSTGSSSG